MTLSSIPNHWRVNQITKFVSPQITKFTNWVGTIIQVSGRATNICSGVNRWRANLQVQIYGIAIKSWIHIEVASAIPSQG